MARFAGGEVRVERVVGDVAVVGDGDHVAVDARELLLVRGLAVGLAREVIAAHAREEVGLRALVRSPVHARDRVSRRRDVVRDVDARPVTPHARVARTEVACVRSGDGRPARGSSRRTRCPRLVRDPEREGARRPGESRLVRIVGVGHGVAGRAVHLGDRRAAGVVRGRQRPRHRIAVLQSAAREVGDARRHRVVSTSPPTRRCSASIAWQLPHAAPGVVHAVSGVAEEALARYSV